jgi:murein DD-endopeptidase MepM/ murein hydrolase activator NlpD
MQFLNKTTVRKNQNISNITSKMFIIVYILLISVFSFSISTKTANAGLFSLISDMASDEVSAQNKEENVSINSQNMALLQVSSNPNTDLSDDDSYTPSVSGNAFIADVGPQGTITEIKEDTSTDISIYTVREGDSLSRIAELFGVSVNTILWANDLTRNSSIREGQVLVILPISGIKYNVKKGDTIKSIVSRHKSNLDEVLKYNDITLATSLKVGDVIIIPDAEPTVVETPKIAKNSKLSNTTSKVHDADGPFYPGYYIKPIEGGRKSQGLHGYNAVDLAASAGTVIRASAAGKVIASVKNGGWNGGYGNYVIISHSNGTHTLYAHNQKNFVSVGDYVEQGQMIAKVGNTGKSTGPHVHFEIRGAKNPF